MILRRLYSFWAIFSMVFFFVLLIIPLLIMVPFKSIHKTALKINCLWAWCFLKMAFIPVRKDWRFELVRGQQYILCANHFSYLDIPILGLFPQSFKFVGKSSLARIPIFGFMYRALHITVNRSSYRSRAQSLCQPAQRHRRIAQASGPPPGCQPPAHWREPARQNWSSLRRSQK